MDRRIHDQINAKEISKTRRGYFKHCIFRENFNDSGSTGISSKEKILKDGILLSSEGRGKSERRRMFIID